MDDATALRDGGETGLRASRVDFPGPGGAAGSGVALASVAGLVALAASVLPLFVILPHDRLAGSHLLPLIVWPLLGLGGVVALDHQPRSAPAWVATAVAAAVPGLLVLAAWLFGSAGQGATDVVVAGAAVAGTGALAADLAQVTDAVSPWLLGALVLPALAGRGRDDRAGPARRWRAWLGVVAAATAVVGGLAWQLQHANLYAVVGCVGIVASGGLVAASVALPPPRPLTETLLDLGLATGVVALAWGAGVVVGAFAEAEQIIAAPAMAWVAGLATAALAVPAALWTRTEYLRRRYGAGVVDPRDLAAVSEGLAADGDPRELLERTAAMLVGASGLAEARLVLDEVEALEGWTARPLTVGAERVGTLLLRAPRDGTIERRQGVMVDRLAPTVALAARAVALAIDAEHARTDAELERERERTRILRDLHDDLGPVLAGLGMRVAAVSETHPEVRELADVVDGLARCRNELRRIVVRLTPSVLDRMTLERALRRLVDSFGDGRGITVQLVGEVPADVPDAVAGVVYRSVAEGVTNAVMHGKPSCVEVEVRRRDVADGSRLEVLVRDDGRGGAVVPGTGLTSLRARAEECDGSLEVRSSTAGLELVVVLDESAAK